MTKTVSSKYNEQLPSVSELKKQAKKRIPSFAFDYIDGGVDEEKGKHRNRHAFHDIQLTPRYLCDIANVSTAVTIFDKEYNMPFGISPIGLGNMMWPGAEIALSTAAQKANIPYMLSTFSTTLLEEIGHIAPDVCWFQLYTPRDGKVMEDILNRAKQAGFHALVVTLDIPVGAKRNRELKNGLQLPFKLSPKMVWEALTHPNWTLATLKQGMPEFVNVTRYKTDTNMHLAEFISDFMVTGVTKEKITKIRQLWDGPLILKGIQNEQNILDAIDLGVDGIIVSNHGGRQLDAAPSSVESLEKLPEKVFDNLTIMIDSGIRTGLDIVRAKALGAQMGFSGRSFFWGMGAMGKDGADQVVNIFSDEITRSLKQLGCLDFNDMDSSWVNLSNN